MVQLRGTVKTWNVFGHQRRFSEVTLPFSEANELFMAYRFKADSPSGNKNEQREIDNAHLRKIKKAMALGEYTPTPGSIGLRKKHRETLQYHTAEDGTTTFTLDVSQDNPLPLTDAGHRMEALHVLAKETRERLEKTTDETEKASLQQQLSDILAAPFTFTIYLDGDTQRDFVNLQAGRSVDSSHLFSLKVQQKVFDDPSFRVAFDTAKLLHKQDDSPFKNTIRFDSRGVNPLPISTLCGRGASDLATSLVGLAKVGLSQETALSPEDLARCVIAAYTALQQHAPQLLEYGKVLTPMSQEGTKGSATMLIGLGLCVAYKQSLGHDLSVAGQALAAAAAKTLDEQVNGGFTGPMKRTLMGRFAREYFLEDTVAKHDGIPVPLLKTLSCSTFAAGPLPREPRKKKNETTTALPDVDGPIDPVTTLANEVREAQAEGDAEKAYEKAEKLFEAYNDVESVDTVESSAAVTAESMG